MSRGVLLAVAFACACGSEPSESVSLTFTVPFSAGQSTCNTTAFGGANTLSVTARIASTPDACDLTIVDLTASGTCEIPYAEIVKFLSLEYALTDPTPTTATLSTVIAVLDLRPDGGVRSNEIVLDLSNPTPPAAALVASPAALGALPADDAACEAIGEDTAERFLCDAEVWWRGSTGRTASDYDLNLDGTSNVDEACAGTLF